MINSWANLKYTTPDQTYPESQVTLNISVQNKPKEKDLKIAAPTLYFSRETVRLYC